MYILVFVLFFHVVQQKKVVIKMSWLPDRILRRFQRGEPRKIVPVLEPCDGDRLSEVRVPFLITVV